MIGKIKCGERFSGCITYCLEDKRGTEAMVGRAEVLHYNYCLGNRRELIQQFNDVRNLNRKVSKPVWHITLNPAPEDRLSKYQLAEIAEECAREFGFTDNQYLAIQHNDTGHPHIHIVVNRVGFDGKVVSDSNNFKRMAAFCRKIELKYGLRQVLSPRKFLPKEQRHLPRWDGRKEQLRKHIQESLKGCWSFSEFERRMHGKGYSLMTGRGISFTDAQAVKTKGSEVGYSLKTIEAILYKQWLQAKARITPQLWARKFKVRQTNAGWSFSPLKEVVDVLNIIAKVIEEVMRAEHVPYSPTPWQFIKKKKKRKGRSL